MKRAAVLAIPTGLLMLPLMFAIAVATISGVVVSSCSTAADDYSPGATGAGGPIRVGTLNWRGASHYTKDPHPEEWPFNVRVPNMVAKINASGDSIVGFQEFETPQARAFLVATDGHWDIVRGKDGGRPDTRDAIAYQPAKWHLASIRYVTIPYGPSSVAIPLAKFSSTQGLGALWVLNTHNPANVIGGAAPMRDTAVQNEAAALKAVQFLEPTTPLLMTGDMNDHARFKNLFLRSAGAGWSTANLGDEQIDWIMGGPGLAFSGTVVDQSTNDGAHLYTDHSFVHTTVQLPATSPQPPITSPAIRPPSGTGSPLRSEAGSGTGSGTGSRTMAQSALSITKPGTGPAARTVEPSSSVTATPRADGGVQIATWTLNADQFHNAQQMVAMTTSRSGTDAAVVIITAALAESGLSTDPGSLGGAYGVLQQTPPGWGTYAQVMNVAYATNGFLDHLAAVAGWRSMPPWQAAQTVQRSGAGQATQGQANYGPKVAEAHSIVAALTGTDLPGAVPVADETANCTTDTSASIPISGGGYGPLTPNTQLAWVGPYPPATLLSRMQQIIAANGHANVDPLFGSEPDGWWYRDCQHFVANLDGRPSSGYGSAGSAWQHFVATGAAHPAGSADGMSAPVGAWLYFSPNHVVVYLGNNLVAGTDTWGKGTAKIGPFSDITNGRWHLPYLGWVVPWGTAAHTLDRMPAALPGQDAA